MLVFALTLPHALRRQSQIAPSWRPETLRVSPMVPIPPFAHGAREDLPHTRANSKICRKRCAAAPSPIGRGTGWGHQKDKVRAPPWIHRKNPWQVGMHLSGIVKERRGDKGLLHLRDLADFSILQYHFQTHLHDGLLVAVILEIGLVGHFVISPVFANLQRLQRHLVHSCIIRCIVVPYGVVGCLLAERRCTIDTHQRITLMDALWTIS